MNNDNQQNNGQQTTNQTPQPKKDNTVLIVGLSIAGVLLLAGIVALVIVLTGDNSKDSSNKSNNNSQTSQATEDETVKTAKCLTVSDALILYPDMVNGEHDDAVTIGEEMFFFLADSTTYEFQDQSDEHISKWIQFYKDHSKQSYDIRLQASTYEGSTSGAGIDLANDRASKIKDALVAGGVPSSRIIVDEPKHSDSFDSARNVSMKLSPTDGCE